MQGLKLKRPLSAGTFCIFKPKFYALNENNENNFADTIEKKNQNILI
jgi:hypothetical protein